MSPQRADLGPRPQPPCLSRAQGSTFLHSKSRRRRRTWALQYGRTRGGRLGGVRVCLQRGPRGCALSSSLRIHIPIRGRRPLVSESELAWASGGVSPGLVRYFPWHMPVPIECSATTQEEGCAWVGSGGSCYPILWGSHATPADQALTSPHLPPLCPHPLAGVSPWGYASRVETTAGHEACCSREGDRRIGGGIHP